MATSSAAAIERPAAAMTAAQATLAPPDDSLDPVAAADKQTI
jgi:hypothetical protein